MHDLLTQREEDKNRERFLRIAVLWHGAIIQEKIFTKFTDVYVGEDLHNDFLLPSEGILPDRFKLFAVKAAERQVSVRLPNKGLGGQIKIGGEKFDVSEYAQKANSPEAGIREVPLAQEDWGLIRCGDLEIFFQFVVPEERPAQKGFWGSLDQRLAASILFTALLHFGYLVVCFILWQDDPKLRFELAKKQYAQIVVADLKLEEKVEIKEEEKTVEGPQEDVGKKAGGEEGKFGEEDSDKEKSIIPLQDGKMVDNLKNVGLIKALGDNRLGSGPLKQIFGDASGFDSSMAEAVAMSGSGDVLVVGRGHGGMGMKGYGGGGGGSGVGRIHGLGKIDTGGGRGTTASLGGKSFKKVKSVMQAGQAQYGDYCAKSDIQQVVSRRSAAVKYCYEQALAGKPSLAGKVVAVWTIDLDGKVLTTKIQSSTLQDKGVESCITRAIQRWQFAKPNGGRCIISYPFIFSGGL